MRLGFSGLQARVKASSPELCKTPNWAPNSYGLFRHLSADGVRGGPMKSSGREAFLAGNLASPSNRPSYRDTGDARGER